MSVIVEGHRTEDISVIVEGCRTEDMSVIVEGCRTEDMSVIVEGHRTDDMPVITGYTTDGGMKVSYPESRPISKLASYWDNGRTCSVGLFYEKKILFKIPFKILFKIPF